jgi:hypothetical protein
MRFPLEGEPLPVQRDPDPAWSRLGLTALEREVDVDRAHDAVAEVLVDQDSASAPTLAERAAEPAL